MMIRGLKANAKHLWLNSKPLSFKIMKDYDKVLFVCVAPPFTVPCEGREAW